MIVKYEVSALWRTPRDRTRLVERIEDAVRRGLAMRSEESDTAVFFRADDVAVPGERCARMFAVFHKHAAPLDAAVTPAWATALRAAGLLDMAGGPARVDFHTHGWRHVNHEPLEMPGPDGKRRKKCEFGPARDPERKRRDLERGMDRLQTLFADSFIPVFTPPWNRCDAEALGDIKELGYAAISRDDGASPVAPAGLDDFPVLVDLHTRREENPDAGMEALLEELAQGLSRPVCGIMLHHQRMNRVAADFVDALLHVLADCEGVQIRGLRAILSR